MQKNTPFQFILWANAVGMKYAFNAFYVYRAISMIILLYFPWLLMCLVLCDRYTIWKISHATSPFKLFESFPITSWSFVLRARDTSTLQSCWYQIKAKVHHRSFWLWWQYFDGNILMVLETGWFKSSYSEHYVPRPFDAMRAEVFLWQPRNGISFYSWTIQVLLPLQNS